MSSDANSRSDSGDHRRTLIGRCRFRLRTLLLLPVLLAILMGVGPRLREEFNPLESGTVVCEYRDIGQTNTTCNGDGSGGLRYQIELALTAEEPFYLYLGYADPTGVSVREPRLDGPCLPNVRIAGFSPKHHLLGHNYTLTVQVHVQGGTIRIGSDRGGWSVATPFPDSEPDSEWKLVGVPSGQLRYPAHCYGMDVGYRWEPFTFARKLPDQPEERRTIALEVYYLSEEP